MMSSILQLKTDHVEAHNDPVLILQGLCAIVSPHNKIPNSPTQFLFVETPSMREDG